MQLFTCYFILWKCSCELIYCQFRCHIEFWRGNDTYCNCNIVKEANCCVPPELFRSCKHLLVSNYVLNNKNENFNSMFATQQIHLTAMASLFMKWRYFHAVWTTLLMNVCNTILTWKHFFCCSDLCAAWCITDLSLSTVSKTCLCAEVYVKGSDSMGYTWPSLFDGVANTCTYLNCL